MVKDDAFYVNHMIDAISKIGEYTKNVNSKKFLSTEMIQDAVIRQIEIIGEASKKISQKTKDKYPKIPWKDIAGMRDKLIHAYFGVDIDAVWITVKEDIPVLKKEINKIIIK